MRISYQTVISSPEDSPENSPENLIRDKASRALSRVYRPIISSSSSESSPDTEKLLSSSPVVHEDLNNLFGRRPDDPLTVEEDSPERLSGSTAQGLLKFPEIDEVTAEDLKNLYDDPQTLQPSGSTALQPYEGNKNASHLTGVSTSELDENLKKLPVEDDHKGKSIERGDASTNPTGFGDHLDDYLDDDLEDDPRTDIQKVDHILQDLPNRDSAVQDLEREHGAGKIAEACLALKDVAKRAKEAHAILSELGVNPSCLLDINEAVRLLGNATNFLQNISDKHPSKKSLNCSDIPSFASVQKRSRDTKRKNRFSQK